MSDESPRPDYWREVQRRMRDAGAYGHGWIESGVPGSEREVLDGRTFDSLDAELGRDPGDRRQQGDDREGAAREVSRSGHETWIVRRFGGAARAMCSCGWGTDWYEMQAELALDLAESEATNHEAAYA